MRSSKLFRKNFRRRSTRDGQHEPSNYPKSARRQHSFWIVLILSSRVVVIEIRPSHDGPLPSFTSYNMDFSCSRYVVVVVGVGHYSSYLLPPIITLQGVKVLSPGRDTHRGQSGTVQEGLTHTHKKKRTTRFMLVAFIFSTLETSIFCCTGW